MLDDRKSQVLRAVIEDYIETAEPVGSRTIARKHRLGVSPATIRNEMADLEETGYLEQPHVSAGRIPSDKGYRFYVDTLMEPVQYTVEQYRQVYDEMIKHYREMERLIQEAGRLLASMTKSAAIVVAPPIEQLTFQHVQLLPVDERDVLVVLILSPNVVKNKIIRTERAFDSAELALLSAGLNQRLKGITYRDLGPTVLREIVADFGEIGQVMVELLVKGLAGDKNEQVYSSGMTHILNQPEFRDVEKAKALIEALEHKDLWLNLLCDDLHGVRVTIGKENIYSDIQDCSLVTATYHVGGHVVGSLGVIGPTRMEYARMLAMVELIASTLSELLTEMK
ncbi:MAG: heat-inducible transcription repressor HrcA [Firmicutes bacterium]|nr:heat-inducible transcription repressor HrcA [Bacillota bacterium]